MIIHSIVKRPNTWIAWIVMKIAMELSLLRKKGLFIKT